MTQQIVHVHHHHHRPRRIPRPTRMLGWAWRRVTGFIPFYGWFRNGLLVILLLWSYATFWPGDAPYFPGAACGPTEQAATGVVGVSYAAGAAVRDLNNSPPTPREVQAALEELAASAGEAVGTFTAAVKGGGAPTEPVEPAQATALVAAGCGGPCKSTDTTPAAVGHGVNLLARSALHGGWTGEDAVVAVAVGMGESGGNPTARNPSSASGLWQLKYPMHADLFGPHESWRDPYDNAEAAHQLWQQQGWQPWTVYTEGTYLQYMDQARAAIQRAGGDGNVITAAVTQDTATDAGCGQVSPVAWTQGGGRLVDWDGETVEVHTAQMLRAAGKILGGHIHVTQGSYSHVKASEGTHAGGGVVDVSPPVGSWDATVAAMRDAGLIAWHRTPDQGDWHDHIHAIDPSSPNLSPEAQAQVESFNNGGDGLGGTDTAVAGE